MLWQAKCSILIELRPRLNSGGELQYEYRGDFRSWTVIAYPGTGLSTLKAAMISGSKSIRAGVPGFGVGLMTPAEWCRGSAWVS